MRESGARRLLKLLLVLYPPAFRYELGSDLLGTAMQRWRDARQEAGWWGESRFWLTEGLEFALDGLLERARSIVAGAGSEAVHAWRQVRRAPRYYGLAVVTLALGVGATTTIFAVADGVVFRPLPYPNADELYLVHTRFGGLELSSNSLPNVIDVQRSVTAMEWLAGVADHSPALTDETAEAARLSVLDVTEPYLPGLGARVLLGRTFAPGDFAGDADRVIVVSHGLWQRRWGADPALLGRSIRLNGVPYIVIGVMQPSFRDPEVIESGVGTDAWAPVRGTAGAYRNRDYYAFRMIGRLDASSREVARQQLAVTGAALSEAYPEANRVNDAAMAFVLHPLREATVRDARGRILLLFGAVLLLLMLSCANVANLFLARGLTRTSELGVRAALGASRARLGAQLFGESLLTAAVASVLGVVLAMYGLQAFLAAAPPGMPRLHETGMDARAAGFIVLLTIGTAVVFGSVPAVRGAASAPGAASGTRTTPDPHARRFQSVLLAAEVALALVLLTGSVLLLTSFRRMLLVDPGFDDRGVVIVDVRPPRTATTHEQTLDFYRALMERAASMPGVSRSALIHSVPGVHGGAWSRITVDDGEPAPGPTRRSTAPAMGFDPGEDFVRLNPVYGDAFDALGISLVAGSRFEREPGPADPLTVVINEAAARRLFPGVALPIGRRLALGVPEAAAPMREVVGVVGDVRQRGAAREPDAQIYLPYGQRDIGRMSLILKLAPGATVDAAVIRRVVRDVAADVPVDRVERLRSRYAATADESRFLALLLTIFAVLGLILAMVGTYATAAQATARRVRELGIRIALGARASSVLGLVLSRALHVVAAGLAAGLLLSLVLTRFLESHVFGVSARDPVAFAAAAAVIGLSAAAASLAPAVRAARVDPNDVLRSE